MSGARIFRAPGRVNLIGEHTDYNLGFVLPIALGLETRIYSTPSADGRLRVHSTAHNETRDWGLEQIASCTPQSHWSDYFIGVAREIAALGFEIAPLDLKIESTVPEGAGLSSSAALEVAAALALLQGRTLDGLEIARLCQRAESGFVGMPCGIMDQYVSLFGREGAATKVDCRTLESEAVPLPAGIAIVAVNSMVKHSLGQSAYRIRVAECAEAARAMGVESLREATAEQVNMTLMPEVVRCRARHIVTENLRVEAFVEAARTGDCGRMGRLFSESHASMRDDYEISCAEIDFLVGAAESLPGCYGARMTGGGFGGCTVNLVAAEGAAFFIGAIRHIYQDAWGKNPQIVECVPAAGAGEIL